MRIMLQHGAMKKNNLHNVTLAFGAGGCKILLFDENICKLRHKKALKAIGKKKM